MSNIVELLDEILNSENLFFNLKNISDFLESSKEEEKNYSLDKLLSGIEEIFNDLLKGFNDVVKDNSGIIQKITQINKQDFFQRMISNSNILENFSDFQKSDELQNVNKISNISNNYSYFEFLDNDKKQEKELFSPNPDFSFDNNGDNGFIVEHSENINQNNITNNFSTNFANGVVAKEINIDSFGFKFSKLFREAVKNRAFDSGY